MVKLAGFTWLPPMVTVPKLILDGVGVIAPGVVPPPEEPEVPVVVPLPDRVSVNGEAPVLSSTMVPDAAPDA